MPYPEPDYSVIKLLFLTVIVADVALILYAFLR